MSDAKPPQLSKTTVEHVLDNLREGMAAQIRERKAHIQNEYMIARRMLQETYADFSPEDLPVDLQRLKRDLEVYRDQRVSDAKVEIEKAYETAKSVVESVAEDHPLLYGKEAVFNSAAKLGTPAGTPQNAAKHLTGKDMHRIASTLQAEAEGVSLLHLCESLQLTSPPAHMATKRFLSWMRKMGYATVKGPTGKGMRYVATKAMRKLIAKLAPAPEA